MISEFMTLNKEEKAEVITNMVEELADETGYPIETCINLIAEYRKCSIKTIKDYIKIIDPILLYNVAFIINGDRVYMTNIDSEVKSILSNKISDLITSLPVDITVTWLRKTIEEALYMQENK